MDINNEALECLEELLELFPPPTEDKFWWPDGLTKLISKVEALLEKQNACGAQY